MKMRTEVVPSKRAAQVPTACEAPSHDYVMLPVETRRREVLIKLGDVEPIERTEVVLAPIVKNSVKRRRTTRLSLGGQTVYVYFFHAFVTLAMHIAANYTQAFGHTRAGKEITSRCKRQQAIDRNLVPGRQTDARNYPATHTGTSRLSLVHRNFYALSKLTGIDCFVTHTAPIERAQAIGTFIPTTDYCARSHE